MKTAVVVVSGAPPDQARHEVDIQPGTTVRDLLAALNLRGYVLSQEGSGHAYVDTDDLYSAVSDGAKLRAAPHAEVGEKTQCLVS